MVPEENLSWDCIEGDGKYGSRYLTHFPVPIKKSGTEPLSWSLASGQQAKQSHKLGAVRRELTHGELGPG